VVVKLCQARRVKRRTGPWSLSFVSRTATVALIVASSTHSPPLLVPWLGLRRVPTSTQAPPFVVL
jgi:hypothetical protein